VAAALEVVEELQREGPREEEVETVRWVGVGGCGVGGEGLGVDKGV